MYLGYRPIFDAFKSLASDASEELLDKLPDIEDLDKVRIRPMVVYPGS
jgi:hypothetical protein